MNDTMKAMSHLLERISVDPQVCFGKPCVRGTRIWVSLLLDFLASGASMTEILEQYPQLAKRRYSRCNCIRRRNEPRKVRGFARQQRGMKFKLDENLGQRSAHLFIEQGHERATVAQEERMTS
jgi:uncharacterized protein (DUF433 family)